MKYVMSILAVGVWLSTTSPGLAAKMMSVQVESGQLRETPSVFGKIITSIPYGERIQVIKKKSPWMQVQTTEGVSGWVHESMLTKKKIKMVAGAEDVSRAASGEELAMAGKGFSSKVEADFKDKNKEIDFRPIDKMEAIKIEDEEILTFLKEGGLGQ